MSLIQTKEKQKDLILIGKVPAPDTQKKTKDTLIYYDPTVKKQDRVKKLSFNAPIESVPYLDIKHNGRSASFISGISGSGKSVLASKIIKQI